VIRKQNGASHKPVPEQLMLYLYDVGERQSRQIDMMTRQAVTKDLRERLRPLAGALLSRAADRSCCRGAARCAGLALRTGPPSSTTGVRFFLRARRTAYRHSLSGLLLIYVFYYHARALRPIRPAGVDIFASLAAKAKRLPLIVASCCAGDFDGWWAASGN